MIDELKPISVKDIKCGKQSAGKQDNPEKDKKEILAGKPVKDVLDSIKVKKVKEKMQEARDTNKPTDDDYRMVMEQFAEYMKSTTYTAESIADLVAISGVLETRYPEIKGKSLDEKFEFIKGQLKPKNINENLNADYKVLSILTALRNLIEQKTEIITAYEATILELTDLGGEIVIHSDILAKLNDQLLDDKKEVEELNNLVKFVDSDMDIVNQQDTGTVADEPTPVEVIDLDNMEKGE